MITYPWVPLGFQASTRSSGWVPRCLLPKIAVFSLCFPLALLLSPVIIAAGVAQDIRIWLLGTKPSGMRKALEAPCRVQHEIQIAMQHVERGAEQHARLRPIGCSLDAEILEIEEEACLSG